MMTRCPQGHYYDSKYSECPSCLNLAFQDGPPTEGPYESPGSGPSFPPTPRWAYHFLRPGTRLRGGKYVVGEVLERNSMWRSCFTYRAWNDELKEEARLIEFFPEDHVKRGEDGVSVLSVPRGGGAVFDALYRERLRPVLAELYRERLRRFLEKARAAAASNHPNLPQAREVFEENGAGYMVLDACWGGNLGDALDMRLAAGPMPEAEALGIMRPVLEGLRALHGAGLLHLAVRPANILLAVGKGPVLEDDGQRLPLTEEPPDYDCTVPRDPDGCEAPERLSRSYNGLGPWTDIYACAAMLYRMLSGQRPPYAGDRLFDEEELRPLAEAAPGVSAHVAEAVRRGLELAPKDRPQSVADFLLLLDGQAPAERPPAAPPELADAPYTNSIGMEFMPIPAGTFLMGSGEEDALAEDSEKPRREARIDEPFHLGKHPVTQAQWRAVMWRNFDPFQSFEGPDLPVMNVTWEDARAFIERLNALEGHNRYRLPTEAEWEYACRAGSETAWHFGDDAARLDDYAWHGNNSDGKTHPVGRKRPNAWGLHDMHGNVSEWVQDEEEGDEDWCEVLETRALRGGSWRSEAGACRSASRLAAEPDSRDGFGFRVALSRSDVSRPPDELQPDE